MSGDVCVRVALALQVEDSSGEALSYAVSLLDHAQSQVDALLLKKTLASTLLSSLSTLSTMPASGGMLLLMAAINCDSPTLFEGTSKHLAERNLAELSPSLAQSLALLARHQSALFNQHLMPVLTRTLLRTPMVALQVLVTMASGDRMTRLPLSLLVGSHALGDAFWSHLTGEADEQRILALKAIDGAFIDHTGDGVSCFFRRLEASYAACKGIKGKRALLHVAYKLASDSEYCTSGLKALLAKETNEELIYLMLMVLLKVGVYTGEALSVELSKQSKPSIKSAYLAALLSASDCKIEAKKDTPPGDAAMIALATGNNNDRLKTMLRPSGALSESTLVSLIAKYPFLPLTAPLHMPSLDGEAAKHLWKCLIAILETHDTDKRLLRAIICKSKMTCWHVGALAEAIRERLSQGAISASLAEILSKVIIATVHSDGDCLELVDVVHAACFAELSLWQRLRKNTLTSTVAASKVMSKLQATPINATVYAAILKSYPQVIGEVGNALNDLLTSIKIPSDVDLQILTAPEDALPVVDGKDQQRSIPILMLLCSDWPPEKEHGAGSQEGSHQEAAAQQSKE